MKNGFVCYHLAEVFFIIRIKLERRRYETA